jgi:hypothetical protein
MISASKIFFIIFIVCISKMILYAQDSFKDQFNYAKKLYEEEKYFDAITEFKRLLFFEKSGEYSFQSNRLIGLSYKYGAKYTDALHYLTLAEMQSSTTEEIYNCRIAIIKINILRRTTHRALALLDTLAADKIFSNKLDDINYWRGWTYIFSDEWENASSAFSLIQPNHQLALLCDSIANDFYSPQLAKILSIVPGVGQFYTGEYVSGLISLGWNVLWGYLTINAFAEDRIFDGIMVGSLLWWRFYSGNLENAEKFALKKNLEKTNSALHYLQNNYIGNKP